jgi:hypothetical protein
MAIDTQHKPQFNPLQNILPKKDTQYDSELNPPENITPSIGTTINAILILTPLSLLLIGLYFGAIDI